MTRLFDPCRKYREDLCAVMSGDLPVGDRAELKKHLQTCAACQSYRNEIATVTALLAAGGEHFAAIQPRQATEARWARDFEEAVEPNRVFRCFLDWSREMVWPGRRIWAGMAAIWLVILGLNVSQGTKEQAQATPRPSPEIMRALLVQEGFLPGAARAGQDPKTEPLRSPSPRHPSDQKRESKTS